MLGLLLSSIQLFLNNNIFAQCVTGETGGTVWLDFDFNGIKDATETTGVPSVTVTAYSCSSGTALATATTNSAGQYSFGTIAAGSFPIRVELTAYPSYLYPTFNGTDGRTTVQFIAAAECAVDFGLLDPADYCQANPTLYLSCYDDGDVTGSSSAGPAIVSTPYDLDGAKTTVATFGNVGSVWGAAYQRTGSRLYNSAFLKRNSGLKNGLSAIFMTKLSPNSFLGNFTLQGVNGIDFGSVTRVYDPSNTIESANPNEIFNAADGLDMDAFVKIGKVGIGDMDIFRDSLLMLVNLNTKSIVTVNVSNPALLPTNGTAAPSGLVSEYPLTFPNSCTNGQMRPFALDIEKGVGYLGAICDGSTGTQSDLVAFVYTFDPKNIGAGLTLVFSMPLNYARDRKAYFSPTQDDDGRWDTWKDSWAAMSTYNDPAYYGIIDNAPILSDIDFDLQGNMVLGFSDRIAHQLNKLVPQSSPLVTDKETGVFAGGDLIKVCNISGTFVLEGDAGCTRSDTNPNAFLFDDKVTAGTANVPEFFYNDFFDQGSTGAFGHGETELGSIVIKPGTMEVVSATYDPTTWFTQGLHQFSTTNGSFIDNYEIVATSTGPFGKGAGLAALELACDAAPLQIGNYVWIDTDKDGVQDPCETPLSGVKVALYKDVSGTLTYLANTTTNASGEYYFTGLGTAGETWTATSGTDSILPYTTYRIVLGYDGTTSQVSGDIMAVSMINYNLTTANTGQGTSADLNDSDAGWVYLTSSAFPSISYTTGGVGSVNHSLDAGFYLKCEINPSVAVSACFDSNGATAGGVSTATVSVTVAWANPANDSISVTIGTETQYIDTVIASNPTVLTFNVLADGTLHTDAISLGFVGNPECDTLLSYTAPLGNCVLDPCLAGETGGTVWQDFNGDGIKDAGETIGVAGVVVTAYDCNGTPVATTTTNINGQYTFGVLSPAPTALDPYRIEFSGIPTGFQPTFNGTDGRTDVQMVTAAACDIDWGLVRPEDYCQSNPLVVTPCYINGEALGGTIAGASDAFVGVPYNYSGTGLSSNNIYLADAEKIGATWGVAVQKNTKTIFTTSVMKRQVSFGPANNTAGTTVHTTGGIYTINYTNPLAPAASLWLDVNTLAAVNAGADPHTGLSGDPNVQNRDAAAFDDVGKISLGDIEISEDGTKLYVVNLNQKTLLEIDIATKALLNSYAIPDPGCKNSDNTIVTNLHFSNTSSSFTGKGTTFTDGRTILTGEAGFITGGLSVDFNATDAPIALYANPAFGDDMNLALAVGNGTYEVNLYFRDYANAIGDRIFDITMEGTLVKDNFDIIAENAAKWGFLNLTFAGGASGNYTNFGRIANQQVFTVTVSDGTLNINLKRVSGFSAIISGIKVKNLGTTPAAVNDFRPWALGVKGSKVYVGGVCSGETSGLRDDISATVYEFSGGTFTSVLSFDLDHERAFANRGLTNQEHPAMWLAWDDDNTYNTWDFKSGSSWIEPNQHQPILSDINFDNAGNMLLGMLDRMAMQVGYGSITPTRSSGILEYAYSAGDLLKACPSGSNWNIEGSSGSCPQAFVGTTLSQDHIGINGGEFFGNEQLLFNNGGAHDETSFGGVAYNKSLDQVVITGFDPKGNINTGGYYWFNDATGAVAKAYEVYSPTAVGVFGKAVGLGDVEFACDPAPLQIGNFVWIDTDQDGTQDPCETALAGVKVALYKDVSGTLTLLATTTTGANGEYYFTGLGTAGETWTATSGTDSILPNTTYKIVFGFDGTTSQFAAGTLTISGINYALTTINDGEGTTPDLNDSDASLMTVSGNSYPAISYTTGDYGSTNHTLDAGFFIITKVALGNLVFMDTDEDGSFDSGTDMGLNGVIVWLFQTGADPGIDIPLAVDTTAGGGFYLFDNLDEGTYFVFLPASNFAAGAPLENKASDAVEGGDTAVDDNADENGQNALVSGGVRSSDIVLAGDAEPTGETGAGSYTGLLDDNNVNMTVDFGFKCGTPPDLSVSPAVLDMCATATIDLATAITVTDANNVTPVAGYPKYYTTAADAAADTNPLASTTISAINTVWVRVNTIGGCWDTVSVSINILETPDITARDTSICAGSSVNLATLFTQDGGAGTISYYGTLADAQAEISAISANITPAATTEYFIRKETAAGCFDIDSVTVTVNQIPVIDDATLVCSGGMDVSTYDFALTGMWLIVSQPAGANAQVDANGVVTAMTLEGNYIFSLTVNGCTDTATLSVPQCCPAVICVPVRVTKN